MPDTSNELLLLTMVEEMVVTCRKCGHVFQGYLHRKIGGESALIDRDGDVIYDLVKTCHFCGEVFHWHSSYRTMQETSKIYHDLFDLLQTLYAPTEIKDK